MIPTRDVPDPPTDVKAEAKPDGTVEVTWTAANGQGRKIIRYEVTAVSGGAGAPVGASNGETQAGHPRQGADLRHPGRVHRGDRQRHRRRFQGLDAGQQLGGARSTSPAR